MRPKKRKVPKRIPTMEDSPSENTKRATEALRQLQPVHLDELEDPLALPDEIPREKTGWYNEQVDEKFHFPYEYDTLAVLIISTPDMFDKGLVPYILRADCEGIGDMLDQCVAEHFTNIKKEFKDCDIEAMHDFEMLPSRRPKVLVQTAGHVSGAAYYYQRKDVQPDPWDETAKIFGVSIHPKYGGWFALRGVLIFKNISWPDLPRKIPVDIVASYEKRKELLERFNYRWQDWTFRDIIPVEKRYSEEQKKYFATPPKDRSSLIETIRSKRLCSGSQE